MILNLLFLFILPSMAEDKVLSHQFFNEYRGCSIDLKMIYLDKAQKSDLFKDILSREIPNIIKSYSIKCAQKKTKVYLLSDLVRTHYQKVFIAVASDKIDKIEVVKFAEPEKYRAPVKFLKSFFGLSDFKRIDALTGATLTRSSLLRVSKIALVLSENK